jgi:AcrR family transcriptional regulator
VPHPATDELAAHAPTDLSGRPGRPRRYDAAQERSLLLDAAFDVIRAKGYSAATVANILGAAGMSTRSFYRHFTSKEDMLHALFRRDAERFAAAVRARVDAAGNPRAALEVWVDEILGFGFDRPRTKRAEVLSAATAQGALAPGELQRALQLLVAPLTEALVAGVADGSLPLADAESDAAMVSALAWDTANRMRAAGSMAVKSRLRAEVLSFTHRALGVHDG